MAAWSAWATRTGRFVRSGQRAPCQPWRRDVDPFCALEVQLALSRIEREIGELERTEKGFARAHHLYAARLAYDQLLREACQLAGVVGLPDAGTRRRVLAEAELRARGWSW